MSHLSENCLSVAVVIPSLTPGSSLAHLLESFEGQLDYVAEVVVVDQSETKLARAIIEGTDEAVRNRTKLVHASPGLSSARNAGIRNLSGRWDVVILPDDDVLLAENAIAAVTRAVAEGATAGSGRLVDAANLPTRLRFEETDAPLTPSNVWKSSIEACYFLTPEFIDEVGVYDENLGLGCATPWKSGEGTDLLLRGMAKGLDVRFVSGYVLVDADGSAPSTSEIHQKSRSYARGTGRVYRLRYGRLACFGLLLRSVGKLLLSLGRGQVRTITAAYVLIGRLEGLLGRTW